MWALVAPLLPEPAATGRPRRWPSRALLDAILYVLRTGYAWRHLPHAFPPWSTAHRWFLELARAGVFERLVHCLAPANRERVGRAASPTGAVLDAQAARSGGVGVAGRRGYDPARRIVGRKRRALTDTDDRQLLAIVSAADRHDSRGGAALLRASRRPWPFLALASPTKPPGASGSVGPPPSLSRTSRRSGVRRALLYSHVVGSSSGPSAGSAAAAGWPRTMRRCHPPRSPFCPCRRHDPR